MRLRSISNARDLIICPAEPFFVCGALDDCVRNFHSAQLYCPAFSGNSSWHLSFAFTTSFSTGSTATLVFGGFSSGLAAILISGSTAALVYGSTATLVSGSTTAFVSGSTAVLVHISFQFDGDSIFDFPVQRRLGFDFRFNDVFGFGRLFAIVVFVFNLSNPCISLPRQGYINLHFFLFSFFPRQHAPLVPRGPTSLQVRK